MAGSSVVEGMLVDWVRTRPTPEPRLPVSWLSDEEKAEELQRLQRNRARDAAREAELILALAADRPDELDTPPGTPGARRGSWGPDGELPGVSDAFPAELSMVLTCGRGTAVWRARRAWAWIALLPRTFAALERGALDERRAQELFDALQSADPELVPLVDAAITHEVPSLMTVAALRRRALELLAELDPAAADENRAQAVKDADVFIQPRTDGVATLGADLPADEAAEAYSVIDSLAALAKTDGDERPIRQIRTEIFSLLLRRPGTAWPAVAAQLTVTAALAALEGGSRTPGQVAGFAITPAQLRELLARVGALGLQTPDGGSLTFALTDEHGRLLATADRDQLRRLATRGCGEHPAGDCGCPVLGPPPGTGAYTPTDRQRTFVRVRDRRCRFPNCGQRVGWADLDHVLPHACGGETACTNLCCLCRSHHWVKTFAPGWRFVMDPDGTLHVTTPSGVTRTTRPPGLRPRAPAPASPDPDPTPTPADPDDDPAPFQTVPRAKSACRLAPMACRRADMTRVSGRKGSIRLVFHEAAHETAEACA